MPMVTVSAAAEALGLNKSTVSRQAREWGLAGPDGRLDLDQYEAARKVRLAKPQWPSPAGSCPAASWAAVHQLRDEILDAVRTQVSDPVEAAACEAKVSAALATFSAALAAAGAPSAGRDAERQLGAAS